MDWNDSVRQLEYAKRVFDTVDLTNHPANRGWVVALSTAKSRGLEFALNRVEYTDLVLDNCFYCTAEPSPINGIDRVDNSKGYVRGNTVTCCKRCNVAKNDHSREEFETWAIRLGANLFKWNYAER